jgi:hypothetical protein
MKDYSSAFLGMILAGVIMLVIGLGLIVTPTETTQPRASFQNEKLAQQFMRFSASNEARPAERESR